MFLDPDIADAILPREVMLVSLSEKQMRRMYFKVVKDMYNGIVMIVKQHKGEQVIFHLLLIYTKA